MNRFFILFLCLSFFISSTSTAQANNDDLCNALALEIGATCVEVTNLDNREATAEPNEPEVSCAEGTPTVSNSVWYSFVATANPLYLLVTPDDLTTAFQMNLFTLSGDCTDLSSLELVSCNTPITNLLAAPSIIATLTEGTTYYVQISGRFLLFDQEPMPNAGTGCLTITEFDAPANDDACNAMPIELGTGPQTFSNLGATTEDNEALLTPPVGDFFEPNSIGWSDLPSIDNSVWFTFTTPSEGGNVLIDLENSAILADAFNSQIALYEVEDCADFSSYSLVAAADNRFISEPSGIGRLSAHPNTTAFCLPGDKTYYLLVDGGSTFFFRPIANQGAFSLDIATLEVEPISLQSVIAGPECAGGNGGSIAIGVEGGAGQYTYAWNTGATSPNLIGELTTGTYTLTVTDQCGAQIVENFEVPITANGPIQLTNSEQTICAPGLVTLNPNPVGGIAFGTKNLFYQNNIDFETLSFNKTFIQQPSIVDTISTTMMDDRVFQMEFIGDQLYGVSLQGELFRINSTTGKLSLVADLNLVEGEFFSVVDLSFVPSHGKLYATSSLGDVFDVNWSTGETSLVLSTGITGLMQVAIDNSGTMYGQTFADQPQGIFKIDLATGILTSIAPSTRNDLGFLALEIDPSTDKLYAMNSKGLGDFTYLEYTELDKTTLQAIQTFSDLPNSIRPISMAFKAVEAPTYQYNWAAVDGINDPSLATQTLMVEETSTFMVEVTDACGATAMLEMTVNVMPETVLRTEIAETVLIGTDYKGINISSDTVLVERYVLPTGCDSIVTYTITAIMPPPANDDLCNAIAIEIGSNCMELPNLNNIGATAEMNEPLVSCAQGTDSVSNSVWYSFVATANPLNLLVTPDDPNVAFQMNLFTSSGACADLASLELVNCNTPITNLLIAPSILSTLTEGATYYVQISGRQFVEESPTADTGTGCFTITEVTSPINDDACNAISIELGAGPQTFSNFGATTQENELLITPPAAPDPIAIQTNGWAGSPTINNSVWFTFTTPSEGANVLIDLESSVNLAGTFNSQIALYEVADCADFNAYSFVAAADNGFISDPSGFGSLSVHPKTTAFCLPGNKTYYLLVNGANSFFFEPIADQGIFSLAVSNLEVEPISLNSVIAGPDCEGDNEGSIAIGVEGGAGEYTYAWNTGATTPTLIGELTAGTYTLTVTDQCGTQMVDNFEVPTTTNGPIQLTNNEQRICAPGLVTLRPEPVGGIAFGTKNLFYQNNIDFGVLGLNNTFIQQPSAVDTISTTMDNRMSEMEFIGAQLYGVNFNGEFFRINTNSGKLSLVGTLDLGEGDFVSAVDLSFVPSHGKLYATSSNGDVFDVNWMTGATSLVLSTGVTGIMQMAIDNSGTIYGQTFASEPQGIFKADLASGILVSLAPSDRSDFGYIALEIDPSTDKLYAMNSKGLGDFAYLEYTELDKTTLQAINTINDLPNRIRPNSFAFKAAAAPTYQYNWAAADGISDPSLATQTLMVSETSTFMLEATDACGTTTMLEMTVNLADCAGEDAGSIIGGEGDEEAFISTKGSVVTRPILSEELTSNAAASASSIKTWAEEDIKIWPNPVTEFLTLETFNIDEPNIKIYLRDIYGRILSTQPFSIGRMQIDLSGLENGYYLLEVRSQEQAAIRRFVKVGG